MNTNPQRIEESKEKSTLQGYIHLFSQHNEGDWFNKSKAKYYVIWTTLII